MTVFYKAVDHNGVSFFPLTRSKRIKMGRDHLLQLWSIWLVDNEPDLHRMRMTHLLGLEKR